MKEQLISYETAVLAKEKGFEGQCTHCYDENKELEAAIDFNGELYFSSEDVDNANENGYEMTVLAPTQSLLQKWLREKHNIVLCIENAYDTMLGYNRGFVYTIDGIVYHNSYGDCYEEYEQALEEGLEASLKLIQ